MKKLILILFGLLISRMLEAQSWSVFKIGTNDTTGFITGNNGLMLSEQNLTSCLTSNKLRLD
tara:strand:- start:231 stop:416 length:186 start_codon:yes stop_codon:yes gene_type:complete